MGLEIDAPCGEDWDAMVPRGGGRHCARCRESVVDLSRMTRRQAERAVGSGQARCGQLAIDEHGRAVFRAEPPGAIARTALRLAVLGALTGCEPASGTETAAVEAREVRDASESDDDGAIPRDPAYFGGSLLTGHRGEMPIAAPRALPRPTSNASGAPSSSASSISSPPSASPVYDSTRPVSEPDAQPAAHPTIQHVRGRVTLRR